MADYAYTCECGEQGKIYVHDPKPGKEYFCDDKCKCGRVISVRPGKGPFWDEEYLISTYKNDSLKPMVKVAREDS